MLHATYPPSLNPCGVEVVVCIIHSLEAGSFKWMDNNNIYEKYKSPKLNYWFTEHLCHKTCYNFYWYFIIVWNLLWECLSTVKAAQGLITSCNCPLFQLSGFLTTENTLVLLWFKQHKSYQKCIILFGHTDFRNVSLLKYYLKFEYNTFSSHTDLLIPAITISNTLIQKPIYILLKLDYSHLYYCWLCDVVTNTRESRHKHHQ